MPPVRLHRCIAAIALAVSLNALLGVPHVASLAVAAAARRRRRSARRRQLSGQSAIIAALICESYALDTDLRILDPPSDRVNVLRPAAII